MGIEQLAPAQPGEDRIAQLAVETGDGCNPDSALTQGAHRFFGAGNRLQRAYIFGFQDAAEIGERFVDKLLARPIRLRLDKPADHLALSATLPFAQLFARDLNTVLEESRMKGERDLIVVFDEGSGDIENHQVNRHYALIAAEKVK